MGVYEKEFLKQRRAKTIIKGFDGYSDSEIELIYILASIQRNAAGVGTLEKVLRQNAIQRENAIALTDREIQDGLVQCSAEIDYIIEKAMELKLRFQAATKAPCEVLGLSPAGLKENANRHNSEKHSGRYGTGAGDDKWCEKGGMVMEWADRIKRLRRRRRQSSLTERVTFKGQRLLEAQQCQSPVLLKISKICGQVDLPFADLR